VHKLLLLICAVKPIVSAATTLTTLAAFNGANGSTPYLGYLVQGLDGSFYGTTEYGGSGTSCSGGCGTLFKITPSGVLTTLVSFSGANGANPEAGLVLGADGKFYGMTGFGGDTTSCSGGCGTVFGISPGSKLAVLHRFNGTDGDNPQGGLVQGTDGNLYGTTSSGAINNSGTVFSITPGGTLTTLHSFAYDGSEGRAPEDWLVQGTDGNFYGTTSLDGPLSCASLCGTVFEITPSGALTTLYSFFRSDGYYPVAGLVQDADGNFYGTTEFGGTFAGWGPGTILKVTPNGSLTTLHIFCSQFANGNCTDGQNPAAGLVQGTDGNFYGTTTSGGTGTNCSGGCGTIFRVTPAGSVTTLHSFNSYDGLNPVTGLVQGTDGSFYGMASGGGTYSRGTVFRLSVGLFPFVKTLPTSGSTGTPVNILGTNLTGATTVMFNNTRAVFTVVSASEISTTVPAGATTGFITVITPGGTLSSNVKFQVRP